MSSDPCNIVEACEAYVTGKRIYKPRGAAFEYAPLATNMYNGCGHRCRYCYVPAVKHITREKFGSEAVPQKNYLSELCKDAAKFQATGIHEQVLMSFTCDPYHGDDTTLTRQTIEVLLEHELAVCILTKGGSRSLRDLDLLRPQHDAYAASLTTMNDSASKYWEPGAALPGDRMAALKAYHDRGIFTWVSLEPTLSAEAGLAIVEATHSYVDLFKIGKANYVKLPAEINWQDYTLRMIELCSRLKVKHYFKTSLACYLPDGYYNPLRIPQHN